jgi:hypothetical protein
MEGVHSAQRSTSAITGHTRSGATSMLIETSVRKLPPFARLPVEA